MRWFFVPVLVVLFTFSREVFSAERRYRLNIPSQNVVSALNLLHKQTGAISLFPYDLVEGKKSSPVVGRYTLSKALSLMLEDTGLIGGLSQQNVINISVFSDAELLQKNNEEKALNTRDFKKTGVAAAFAALITGTSANAQTAATGANADVLEEITVVGIRNSLARAADIKRNASGVVDAISATDIGKFPDTNLAESLQRITGVSIDRSNNEGNQITVRGFGPRFNLVTLNGRTMPTSTALNELGISRGFNFNELASSSVSAVEVFKTGRADLPTGGIGSTVNIKTAKPLDFDGFTLAGTAKANYDTTNVNGSDITPDVSFVISDHFADKKLGLLASVSYSERDSREEQGHVSDSQRASNRMGVDAGIDSSLNQNPDDTLFLVRNFNLEVGDTSRERTNAQFVLQYAPTDNLEIDLDYTLSRFSEQRVANSTGFWFGFNGTRSGVARPDGVVNLRDINQDIDFFGINQVLESDNDSYGINIDWAVNDRLSFNLDAHSSSSESQPDGDFAETIVNIFTRPLINVGLDFTDTGDIPDISFNSTINPFDRANLLPDIALQRGFQVENEVEEVKFVGNYDFLDGGFLKRINFGAAYTDYQYNSANTFNFVFIGGPNVQDLDISPLDIRFVDRGSIGSDFTGGAGLFSTLGFYDPLQAIELAESQGYFGNPTATQNLVNEETLSYFVSADFEATVADMPLTARLGVRFEETDTTGSTIAQLGTGTQFASGAQLTLLTTESFETETDSASYDFVLPSLDVGLNISDNLLARFSYSETLTRAPISELSPSTDINDNIRPGDQNTGIFEATRGNTSLEPAISENIDLSLEWYYKEGSYASLGFFNKDVNAFINSERTLSTIAGAGGQIIRNASANPRPGCPSPVNPACASTASDPEILFTITRPENSDVEGSVRGLELAWQHAFENGFGFIANYTYTDGDIEFDVSNFGSQSPSPLTGLSDSANLIVFFERDKYEARIAYNWRDEFLSGFLTTGEPTFTEAYQQLDFSATYHINDKYSVFVEGLNITDETTRTHGRSRAILRDVFSAGPRFAVGFRGRF